MDAPLRKSWRNKLTKGKLHGVRYNFQNIWTKGYKNHFAASFIESVGARNQSRLSSYYCTCGLRSKVSAYGDGSKFKITSSEPYLDQIYIAAKMIKWCALTLNLRVTGIGQMRIFAASYIFKSQSSLHRTAFGGRRAERERESEDFLLGKMLSSCLSCLGRNKI